MEFTIRLAKHSDTEALCAIYNYAKQIMRREGNPTQWTGDYPSLSLIEEQIDHNECYIIEDTKGDMVGTFCAAEGEEPFYSDINGEGWLNDAPYVTIHRVASNERAKGVMQECLRWFLERYDNIRVDTHHDNTAMRHILSKNGFLYCGIIHLANGDPRVAYHWAK